MQLNPGTHLVIGLSGTALDAAEAEHLRRIRPAGIILFARNYASPDQLRDLVAAARQALEYEPLVMVDHEGGRILRFSSGVTRFPSAAEMADQGGHALYEQGRIEARELRALGITVNLAPCADVRVDGADPVIGDRSYGADPWSVAELAAARIRGLQENGVLACAKHFPGIGALSRDPHKTLSSIELDPQLQRRRELRPFRAAMDAGVSLIMSSHIIYPRIGPEPATFSRAIMTAMLRDELKFAGAAITDDLEMGAVAEVCPIEEAAVRAVDAGHDLLLVCHRREVQARAREALDEAYASGKLPAEALERAAERVGRLKAATGPPC